MDDLAAQEKKFSMKPMIAGMMGIMMLIIAMYFIGTMPQPPSKPYKCPYCDASFDTLAELIAHVASEHPDKPPIQMIDIVWE